jgi:3'-5' exoribonuclease
MPDTQQPEKGPWIADLEAGQRFIGYYLARNARLEPFRDPTRGKYLRLHLADQSGVIEGRAWENAEDLASLIEGHPVLKVEGEVERFRDQLQIRILRLRPADEGEYVLRDLRPATKRDVDQMMHAIDDVIASIDDPHIQSLVYHFFEDVDFRTAFQTAPAATRVHHACIGGLLEHTFEVLQLAQCLLELYPQINRDLLIAGILLHDIGKLEEFTWEFDIEYTDRGRLLGHVILGSEWVAQAITSQPDFPQSLEIQLQHLILSHHGRYEFGSPRRPKTLEAIALHHLENLDAQVNRFASLIDQARKLGRDWTTYDSMLGRSLYTNQDDGLPIEEQGFID